MTETEEEPHSWIKYAAIAVAGVVVVGVSYKIVKTFWDFEIRIEKLEGCVRDFFDSGHRSEKIIFENLPSIDEDKYLRKLRSIEERCAAIEKATKKKPSYRGINDGYW